MDIAKGKLAPTDTWKRTVEQIADEFKTWREIENVDSIIIYP